ncbi:WD domain, g-beta repeat domain-containing protein [Trichoderma breve]|uniref:Mitochondrial division protein 1 n=1 Tax=Trichoderma breve TaxID=2034170 RepID=A0A9W9JQL7_9HYPO|nr:WD domain, g-beta repeat domain-containing protein [Trichoderma breve]KAJ4864208.1 WD domain, g-beta repeat domain-containing protein [Trichoderma breve]
MGEKHQSKASRFKSLFRRDVSPLPPPSGSRVGQEIPDARAAELETSIQAMTTEGQSLGQGDAHGSKPLTSSTTRAEPTEQQCTSPSKSQDLWNATYESLVEDKDTINLVRSYVTILATVLNTTLPEAEVLTDLNDRTKRQDFMRKLVEEGQARISTTSNVLNGVSAVAEFIVSVKGLVDAAVQNIPQAALPWAGVCIGLQILTNPANARKSNLDGMAHVISRMEWYCSLTECLMEKDDVDDWENDYKAIRDAEDVLRHDLDQYIKVQGKTMLEELLGRAKGMVELLGDLRQTLQDIVIYQKSNLDERNKQCLRDLFVVDPQDDMKKIEKNKDTLLSEANNWIFQMEEYQAFTNWNNTGSMLPSCRLLWIKGHAGTGKTMLLMSIIRELLSHSAAFAPKVSHFFCQGTVKALNTGTATLRCLIWMLLIQQPHLISHLKSKYDNAGASLFEGDCVFISLNDAFENMLKDPKLSPVYLVVDALDEFNAFINHKISLLKGRPGYTDEILEQARKEVSQRAENTFLWVALVFKELDKEDGNHIVVDGMYALDIIKEIPSGLSKLYDYMMGKIEKGLRQDREYCRNVLVATLLAFRPLTLSEVGVLAQLPNKTPATIVRKCGSFLTVQNEMVYLIHQSAKDYLQENYKSKLWKSKDQPAEMSQGHEDIAMYSIRAMSSGLRQNMYNLDYGFKPDDMRPPQPDPLGPLQYSCVFWADHLTAAIRESFDHERVLADDGEVLKFMREKFLHWLEALSIVGNLLEGADAIKKLLSIAQLTRFLEDAERFIQSHGSIIERAPLQAYGSALVFSPRTSEVKAAQWKHRLPFIKMLAGVKIQWDSHRQTLDAGDEVNVVAFSPNSRILASALGHIVQFWDASTGSPQRTLEGHTGKVRSIAFSSDGKILASSSDDNTIRLWDASTGSHQRTLVGHIGKVRSIAFSPDNTILASSSIDNTIRLWDIALGSCRQKIEEHDDGTRYKSVAFSPDGRILASVSGPGILRLGDVALGKYQQKVDEEHAVRCVAFSPGGNILAVLRVVSPIQLWDTSSWRTMKTLDINAAYSSSLVFSPNGKMLAFMGPLLNILLWDMATESIWDTLVGHRDEITSLAFSPDGMTLASASCDRTIKLWDISSGNRHSTVEEHNLWHSGESICMTFSPDGETMVSASRKGFQVWDTATWGCEPTISQKHEGHPYKPIIVFSPDGKTLALALDDGIELWDTATWTCRLMQKEARPFDQYESTAAAVAFSPDSKTLATASRDETISCWLWDATTGSTLWTLDRDRETRIVIRSVAFSPDGKTLAFALDDCIDLWDAATGIHQQGLSLEDHCTDPEPLDFPLLAFSPNGKTLASASSWSRYNDIWLWHKEGSGRWSNPEKLTNGHAFCLGFSPDGAHLLVNYRPVQLLYTLASLDERFDEDSAESFLYFEQEWIMLNGKEILWLPADYRPYPRDIVIVHGNKMAWVNQAGSQMFFQVGFAEGMPRQTE